MLIAETKDVIKGKEEQIIKLKNDLRTLTSKLSEVEEKLAEAEKETNDLQHSKGKNLPH